MGANECSRTRTAPARSALQRATHGRHGRGLGWLCRQPHRAANVANRRVRAVPRRQARVDRSLALTKSGQARPERLGISVLSTILQGNAVPAIAVCIGPFNTRCRIDTVRVASTEFDYPWHIRAAEALAVVSLPTDHQNSNRVALLPPSVLLAAGGCGPTPAAPTAPAAPPAQTHIGPRDKEPRPAAIHAQCAQAFTTGATRFRARHMSMWPVSLP